MTSVAIGICTRDRPDELAETLGSIAAVPYRVDHVVVSDDGTDLRTPEVCAAAPLEVHYTIGPHRGLGANRNHALDLIGQDFVLFLDDDCLLGAEFLQTIIPCMAEQERVNGFGRVIVTGAEINRGITIVASAQTFLGFQARPYRAGEVMTSVVVNAALFPRPLFERYRFDEQIRYGYEEVDLTSRAARGGYRIVSCPGALNNHRPSRRGRDDYAEVVVASRLFVTFKRYVLTERGYGRAAAFAAIAPLHAIGSGMKTRGWHGAADAVRAIWLACRYLKAHLAGGSVPPSRVRR